jgi:muconolactone delta-isomerase
MKAGRKSIIAFAMVCCGSLFGVDAAMAQPAPPPAAPSMVDVPTTRVLAIGTVVGTPDRATMAQVMPGEVRATVDLHLKGKIDQWFVRKDGRGVVFLMNVDTVDEAHRLLEALPLGEKKLMTFELMPLGPLTPLRFLLPPR